jgi:hypothetical protein
VLAGWTPSPVAGPARRDLVSESVAGPARRRDAGDLHPPSESSPVRVIPHPAHEGPVRAAWPGRGRLVFYDILYFTEWAALAPRFRRVHSDGV